MLLTVRVMLVLQLRWSGRTTEERDERIDEHVEGLVVRAHQEPVPDQGREDHARHHHQDDADPGIQREYVFFVFFQISKKRDFLRFLK